MKDWKNLDKKIKGGGTLDITPKEELYVQGLVSGLSQREAYKQAYNCERMKDETIDNKASKLFKKNEVRTRFEELMNEHKQKALWTLEEATNTLKFLVDEGIKDIKLKGLKQANSNAIINSVKELNAINGVYDKPLNEDDTVQIKIVRASEKNE